MIVSIVSNKYNSGQSISAINIAMMTSLLKKSKTLIIDTHMGKHSQIEKYLSNSVISNGLDDFINYNNMNIVESNFNNCISELNENIDFMASNKATSLKESDVQKLKEMVNEKYKVVIVDATLDRQYNSLLEISDLIILVTTQDRNNINEINNFEYNEKLVLLVNKYDKNVTYSDGVLINDLKKHNIIPRESHKLAYSPLVQNSANSNAILNVVLNKSNYNDKYFIDLEKACKSILDLMGENYSEVVNRKRGKIWERKRNR